MKIWEVTIPITGYICKTVELSDDSTEDDAWEKAESEVKSRDDIESFECHRAITEGNVCYAEVDEAEFEVTKIPDENDGD